MTTRTFRFPAARWLLVLALLLGGGVAYAQSEPTMDQVYEAAHAGHLDQAQTMMKQVLAAHPNSAKAHFVEAELLAQQGRTDAARTSLATAERLQPGLPFATPAAVSGLRARLSGSGLNGLSGVAPRTSAGVPATTTSRPAAMPASAPSFSLFWPIVLIVVVVALFLMFRRRAASQAGGYVTPNGMPQGYATGAQPYGQPGGPYAQPPGQPYGQPYGQPAPQGSGLGSRIAGGLATGAAIGAGMMAAEAIGRSLGGHSAGHDTNAFGSGVGSPGGDAPIPAGDLGGQDFGIRDTGWDDSGSAGSSDFGGGGGGDWDS